MKLLLIHITATVIAGLILAKLLSMKIDRTLPSTP